MHDLAEENVPVAVAAGRIHQTKGLKIMTPMLTHKIRLVKYQSEENLLVAVAASCFHQIEGYV